MHRNKSQRLLLGHWKDWWAGDRLQGRWACLSLANSWPTEVGWRRLPSLVWCALPEASQCWKQSLGSGAECQAAPLFIAKDIVLYFPFPFIFQDPWIIYLLLNPTEWDFKGDENCPSSNRTKSPPEFQLALILRLLVKGLRASLSLPVTRFRECRAESTV